MPSITHNCDCKLKWTLHLWWCALRSHTPHTLKRPEQENIISRLANYYSSIHVIMLSPFHVTLAPSSPTCGSGRPRHHAIFVLKDVHCAFRQEDNFCVAYKAQHPAFRGLTVELWRIRVIMIFMSHSTFGGRSDTSEGEMWLEILAKWERTKTEEGKIVNREKNDAYGLTRAYCMENVSDAISSPNSQAKSRLRFFFWCKQWLRLAHKNIMSVTRIYLYSTSLAEGEIFFIQMIQHTSENPRHILHKSFAIVNALPVVCVCVDGVHRLPTIACLIRICF